MSAKNKRDGGCGGQTSIASGTHYRGLNSVVLNPNLIIVTPDTQEIHWLEGGVRDRAQAQSKAAGLCHDD